MGDDCMIFDSSDMIKHGIENYIFPTKIVGSDNEKWAQIQYKTYRFIDFSLLKSRASVDFRTVSLYQTKVQPSDGLYHTKVPRSSRIPGPAHTDTTGHPTGWYLRAGELEAGAGSWTRKASCKLQAGNCKLNESWE